MYFDKFHFVMQNSLWVILIKCKYFNFLDIKILFQLQI
jgi:hypothetical protein